MFKYINMYNCSVATEGERGKKKKETTTKLHRLTES